MLEELLPIFINQYGLDVTFKQNNTQAAVFRPAPHAECIASQGYV